MEVDEEIKALAKEAGSQLGKYAAYLKRIKENLRRLKMKNNNGDDEDEFKKVDEDLVKSPISQIEEESVVLRVSEAQKIAAFGRLSGGFHSAYDHTIRYGLRLILTKYNFRIETLTDIYSGKSVRADINEYGPERSSVTWPTLSMIIKLAVEYAMPIERIGAMLGGFSGKQIFNWLYKSAQKLLPIYLYLAELLAEARYLSYDDSPTNVIEIRKKLGSDDYGCEKDDEIDPLVLRVADVLGRGFNKADGTGKKQQVNVTVMHGSADQRDPCSYVVFYRSHNGAGGNLLSKLLAMRRRKNKRLTVQCDLSSQNQADALYYNLFEIETVGCGAHARRDIWRYKHRDDWLCGKMLRAFAMLSHIEHIIDIKGRTKENITYYRGRYSRWIWKIIYNIALSVISAKTINDCKGHRFWPKKYKLHGACSYIVKHYPKLTAYLSDPHLFWTNNLSERLLRGEKMLLVACKFRLTERGRVVFDILRTLLTTCRAAKVSFTGYLQWINKFSDEEIKADPGNFTPAAYNKTVKSQEDARQQQVAC